MKLKKNEDQSVESSPFLRIGNKTPMEGVTETKFGAETKGWTIQRLPHLGIHPIISFQTLTPLHILARFYRKDPDVAVSCETMPGPSKHRSGCSQSANGWITGLSMEELEKVPKELRGLQPHRRNNNMNQPVPPELPGTKPPYKEYAWRDP